MRIAIIILAILSILNIGMLYILIKSRKVIRIEGKGYRFVEVECEGKNYKGWITLIDLKSIKNTDNHYPIILYEADKKVIFHTGIETILKVPSKLITILIKSGGKHNNEL